MNRYLQVKINGLWQYVFCHNPSKALPVTTEDKAKALPPAALEHFEKKFGNLEFRLHS